MQKSNCLSCSDNIDQRNRVISYPIHSSENNGMCLYLFAMRMSAARMKAEPKKWSERIRIRIAFGMGEKEMGHFCAAHKKWEVHASLGGTEEKRPRITAMK